MAGNKKKKSDLDALKAEMTSLSEAVWALRERLTVQAAADAARESSGKPSRTVNGSDQAGKAAALERTVRERDETRLVSTYGYYEAGDRGYRWAREELSAADLLALDDERVAQLLSALGHRQRLAILKAVLERPCSAAELVDRLQLGTTGAAYHHLNVLQAADLVAPEGRGVFAFHGHRVPGFLTLLAGVAEMMDPTFTAGPFALAGSNDGEEDGAG